MTQTHPRLIPPSLALPSIPRYPRVASRKPCGLTPPYSDPTLSGLDEVVARIFPKLLLLLRELLSQPWAALAQADMIKLVLKSFWSANYLHVPKPLVDASVFLPWLESIVAVIQHPVPEGQPEDLDERKRWSWWKVKKWAMHIAGRLISRLGDQVGVGGFVRTGVCARPDMQDACGPHPHIAAPERSSQRLIRTCPSLPPGEMARDGLCMTPCRSDTSP